MTMVLLKLNKKITKAGGASWGTKGNVVARYGRTWFDMAGGVRYGSARNGWMVGRE